ncbi:MAG TPA: hypothetical protein V6D47_01250 [Oscillatoriaceae cyanobacterium]
MATVGSSGTISKTALSRGVFSASNLAGKGGVLVRKLLTGQALTAAERDLVATTGLGSAVGNLVVTASSPSAGGLAGFSHDAQIATQVRNVQVAASQADKVYAQNHAGYARLSSKVRGSAAAVGYDKTQSAQDKFFSAAGDVATVAGLGLSAVALPGLAQKTVTDAKALGTVLHDPAATQSQRLDAVKNVSQDTAGSIYSADGVYIGLKGTTAILSRSKTIGSMLDSFSNSRLLSFLKYNPVGKLFGMLLPIADGAVFVGQAISTKDTFENPTATESDKLKSVLQMGLATIKLSFWIFPDVAWLKQAYSLANFGQLALVIWNMRKTIVPKMVNTAKAIGWGVMHPIQAFHNICHAVATGASTAVQKAGTALSWLFGKAMHPVQTFDQAASLVGLARAADTQPTVATTPAAPGTPTVATTTPVLAAPTTPAVTVPVAPVTTPVVPVTPAPAPQAAAPLPLPAVAPVAPSVVTAAPSVNAAYQAAMSQIAPGSS